MARHVVLYSGGLVSWRTAELVIEEHGPEEVVLLFTDTLIEDEDLYRFLNETSSAFGVEVTRLADGRDPWQVFFDSKFLGNTRVDPCSRVLKRQLTRKWLKRECDPNETVVYIGFDMWEEHRYKRSLPRWKPWTIRSPMIDDKLYEDRTIIKQRLRSIWGIEPPRMYEEGFSHNNCGGFCIKAGQGHFAHLLKMRPELYAHHEKKEQEFREFIGKDVAILRTQEDGATKPLTLKTLRERIEADDKQVDLLDVRGCACFFDLNDED